MKLVLHDKDIYLDYLEHHYKKLRLASYQNKVLFHDGQIHDLTAIGNNKIDVQHHAGWHYRWPKKNPRYFDFPPDRISLNVLAHPDLIHQLDKYLVSGKVNMVYKTPERAGDWLKRHDPITIYFYEPLTPAVIKDLETLVKPYIRSKADVMPGKLVTPGMVIEKTPTTQDAEKLVKRAQQLDKELVEVVKDYIMKNGQVRGSTGQVVTVERFWRNFQNFLNSRLKSCI